MRIIGPTEAKTFVPEIQIPNFPNPNPNPLTPSASLRLCGKILLNH